MARTARIRRRRPPSSHAAARRARRGRPFGSVSSAAVRLRRPPRARHIFSRGPPRARPRNARAVCHAVVHAGSNGGSRAPRWGGARGRSGALRRALRRARPSLRGAPVRLLALEPLPRRGALALRRGAVTGRPPGRLGHRLAPRRRLAPVPPQRPVRDHRLRAPASAGARAALVRRPAPRRGLAHRAPRGRLLAAARGARGPGAPRSVGGRRAGRRRAAGVGLRHLPRALRAAQQLGPGRPPGRGARRRLGRPGEPARARGDRGHRRALRGGLPGGARAVPGGRAHGSIPHCSR